MAIRFESDWLGTQPYFYHEKSGASSARIHEVIDYRNLEFDPDGLTDYLEFGYCAFGRTPVRHVRFVPPCTRLVADATGQLREEALPDPVDAWRERRSRPDEVIERIRAEIAQWERTHSGDVVLPLSGGYDSRLLALLSSDPRRLRTFTYGVSTHQAASREVTRAQAVAAHLGARWERIPLGDFHGRMDEWDDHFGVSTHAHGMYHLEFYEKIAALTGPGRPLLSGLVGDAWAGSIARLPAASAADLPTLGLSRGVNAGALRPRLRGEGAYRAAFWAARRERFQDPVFQIVEVIRQKMLLLAFAFIAPGRKGFAPWSPFLVPDVALAMITLPAAARHRRRWQREFFAQHHVDVERTAGGSGENNLDLRALHAQPPAPLDATVLRELFEFEAIERINRQVFAPGALSRHWALVQGYPFFAKAAGRLRTPNPHLAAYAAYLTLRPLEQLLRRRAAA